MKKASDILNSFLDKNLYSKAEEYNRLFTSWDAIAGERVASHSNIRDLEKTVLVVEADHPGWIQILQAEQTKLLKKVQKRFPELNISAISFYLSKNRRDPQLPVKAEKEDKDKAPETSVSTSELYDRIDDEDFKNKLLKLENSIKNHNK